MMIENKFKKYIDPEEKTDYERFLEKIRAVINDDFEPVKNSVRVNKYGFDFYVADSAGNRKKITCGAKGDGGMCICVKDVTNDPERLDKE